jgi:hypothetical protein
VVPNLSVKYWNLSFNYLLRPGMISFDGGTPLAFFDAFSRLRGVSAAFGVGGGSDSFFDRAFFFPTNDSFLQHSFAYCSLFFYNLFEVTSYFSGVIGGSYSASNGSSSTVSGGGIFVDPSAQQYQPVSQNSSLNIFENFSTVKARGGSSVSSSVGNSVESGLAVATNLP